MLCKPNLVHAILGSFCPQGCAVGDGLGSGNQWQEGKLNPWTTPTSHLEGSPPRSPSGWGLCHTQFSMGSLALTDEEGNSCYRNHQLWGGFCLTHGGGNPLITLRRTTGERT